MSVKLIVKWGGLIFGLFIIGLLIECSYEISYRLIYGKASHSTEVIFCVPNSKTEIILARRCIHLFLAEYERTLILRINGKNVLQKEAAVDSGGYSRMNIYQISPTKYFLQGALSFDRYEIDITKREIEFVTSTEKTRTTRFIGVFDGDEKHDWRFISATELK